MQDSGHSLKTRSRDELLAGVEELRHRRRDVVVDLTMLDTYAEALNVGFDDYAESLGSSRIALCPRGTVLETFRHYEALAAGCVVITDRRPPGPLETAPLVVIREWSQLGDTVGALLSDERRLDELHDEALAWWQRVCTPQALAARLLAELPRSA